MIVSEIHKKLFNLLNCPFFTVTETQMDEMGILGGLGDLERMIQNTTDSEKIQHKGNDILLLIEKRNNKCNVLKHQV